MKRAIQQRLHLVIDTNIYTADVARRSGPFKALARLCQSGFVQLHIPYIVQREFESQREIAVKKIVGSACDSMNEIVGMLRGAPQAEQVDGIKHQLDQSCAHIQQVVNNQFLGWIKDVFAEVHPLSLEETRNAWEAYFRGLPPLSEPKVRKHIPDSFIFQSIKALLKKHGALVVIARDGGLANASEELPEVDVYRSLQEFIEQPSVQAELQRPDVELDMLSLVGMLREYEHKTQILSAHIRNHVSDEVERIAGFSGGWTGILIEGGDGSAVIVPPFSPKDIELEFDRMSYYGRGEFGLPFRFSAVVSVIPTYEDEGHAVLEKNRWSGEHVCSFSGRLRISISVGLFGQLSAEALQRNLRVGFDFVFPGALESRSG